MKSQRNRVYIKSKRQSPLPRELDMVRTHPAIILAAGASQRLGQPKSLVRIGDTTLVGMAYKKLDKAGCSPIVIVTRSELVFDIMQETVGSTVLSNPSPEKGRTGSLQCALLSLAGEKGRLPKGVIVAPVDRPGWTIAHVKSLLTLTTSAALAFKGRKGHPVFMDSVAIESVLTAKADASLRELVRFTEHVVEAPLIGLNIDTPEDLQTLSHHEQELLNEL